MFGIGRHRNGEKKPRARTSSSTITIGERLGAGTGRGRSHRAEYIFFEPVNCPCLSSRAEEVGIVAMVRARSMTLSTRIPSANTGVHPNPDALFFVHGLLWRQSVFNLQRSKNDHENEDDDEDDCAAKHHWPPACLFCSARSPSTCSSSSRHHCRSRLTPLSYHRKR